MFSMLDSTLDILTSLQEKYHVFSCGHEGLPLGSIRTDRIAFGFHEAVREVQLIRKQLDALYERVKSSVQLLSSLLDLENGQSLQKLAEESRKENTAMRILTEKSGADASAVKVITIITLIYLPTSVVTNFFSTTFVTSQPNGSGTDVAVAGNWWVLAAVSLPLTVVTCAVWWLLQHKSLFAQMARSAASKSRIKIQLSKKLRSAEKPMDDEEQSPP